MHCAGKFKRALAILGSGSTTGLSLSLAFFSAKSQRSLTLRPMSKDCWHFEDILENGTTKSKNEIERIISV